MEMKIMLGENQRVEAHYKGHVVKTDQSVRDGGDNSAPSPFDLFLVSIGTCAGFYVQSFCRERDLPFDEISLVQRTRRDKEKGLIIGIDVEIVLPASFPEKYKGALIKAAGACTVKKHLQQAPEITVNTRCG